MLDLFALIGLTLAIYRQPIWRYKFPILIFAIVGAIVSPILRVYLALPVLDLIVQPLLVFLLLRFAMQLKSFYSAIAVLTGYAAYVIIQSSVIQTLVWIGRGEEVLPWGPLGDVQTVQVASIALGFTIAALFKIFGLGFSFIVQGPHEFSMKEDYSSAGNRGIIISACVAAVMLAAALVFLFHLRFYFLVPLAIPAFAIIYYAANRRDRYYDH